MYIKRRFKFSLISDLEANHKVVDTRTGEKVFEGSYFECSAYLITYQERI